MAVEYLMAVGACQRERWVCKHVHTSTTFSTALSTCLTPRTCMHTHTHTHTHTHIPPPHMHPLTLQIHQKYNAVMTHLESLRAEADAAAARGNAAEAVKWRRALWVQVCGAGAVWCRCRVVQVCAGMSAADAFMAHCRTPRQEMQVRVFHTHTHILCVKC